MQKMYLKEGITFISNTCITDSREQEYSHFKIEVVFISCFGLLIHTPPVCQSPHQ